MALESITKESKQGLDQTCSVLPGQTTATGQPTWCLALFFNLIHFPNSTMMDKTDKHHQKTADKCFWQSEEVFKISVGSEQTAVNEWETCKFYEFQHDKKFLRN